MFKKCLMMLSLLFLVFLVGCDLTSKSTLSTTDSGSTDTTTSITTTDTDTTNTTSTTTTTSEVGTISYESLFENLNYKKFVISFAKANFDKLVDDMENYYDQYGNYRDNTIQQVDITYEDGYGNMETWYEVGFRTKGNIFSRRLPVIFDNQHNVIGYQQVSFQLEFNETFDYPVNSTEYKALDDRRVFDLEQLNFKFVRADDNGAVTEMIAYDLYREVGVAAPNTSLAVIYFDIDGELVPYGLFTVTEPIDDVFVRRYFGKNPDNTISDLYKCVWQNYGPATLLSDYNPLALGVSDYNEGYRKTYQLKTNKLTSDFSSFTTFISRLNNDNAYNYENSLAAFIDMDNWLRSLAMAYLIGNPDDYRNDANNYYLYFKDGKAVYIPFDSDQCLGFGWNPFGDYTLDLPIYDYNPAQSYIGSAENLPMVANVLRYQQYRDIYEQYLLEFTDPLTGAFRFSLFQEEFLVAKALYEAELNQEDHLGLTYFNMSSRWLPAEAYFAEKIENTRNQLS